MISRFIFLLQKQMQTDTPTTNTLSGYPYTVISKNSFFWTMGREHLLSEAKEQMRTFPLIESKDFKNWDDLEC